MIEQEFFYCTNLVLLFYLRHFQVVGASVNRITLYLAAFDLHRLVVVLVEVRFSASQRIQELTIGVYQHVRTVLVSRCALFSQDTGCLYSAGLRFLTRGGRNE